MNIVRRRTGYLRLDAARHSGLLKATFSVLVASALAGCMGWAPGRQANWDARVKEMCEKDGGVAIYERVPISKVQFEKMGKVGGHVSIPPRESAKADDPLFWDESVTLFRDANPRVWRSEHAIKRRTDEKVVARVVRYSRVGGDIPSPAHQSHLGCPDEKEVFAQREKV